MADSGWPTGPMERWGVPEVLRLIQSIDGELFDEVQQKFSALDFTGKCRDLVSH